jgi:hypothetical protein
MSFLEDLFDPLSHNDHVQGNRLRDLSRSMRTANRRRRQEAGDTRRALEDLEEDVGLLALLLLVQLKKLMASGMLTKEEILETLAEIDGLDDKQDGGLDPNTLRKVLGLPVREPKPPGPVVPGKRRRRS